MARSTFHAALTCVALLALTLLSSGCANFSNIQSCIDPTGERFFKHDPNSTCGKSCKPGSHHLGHHAPKPINCNPEPGKIGHEQPIGLCITPQRIVAPVGAEVVLKAAICDQKGMTTANEKVEWTIAPGGVGHFVALGQRPWYDTLLGATTPNKITATYAVNSTSSKYMCLNRGTPDRGDDVPVIKGQAWVTVTSPLEGSSQITAFAPNVYGWDQRQKTATIYFVDAQWQFPPPASNPAGTRQTFTTSVARQTTGCPVPGWHVRYEIISGPEAGLVPTNASMAGYGAGQTAGYPAAGAKILEMPTDALGHASVDLVQSTPQPGTNQVSIQIIRPGEASLDGTRLMVATGTTERTWGASELYLRKTGPVQASLGSTMIYGIEVRNASSQTARGVVVTEALPPGTSLIGSTPSATPSGATLTWNFGDLSAGESRHIDLSLRADRFGTINNCATVRTADGTTSQDCVTTTITGPSIDVVVSVAPEQAMVGQQATFTARVTNRSGDPARGLVIVERYDSGLQHSAGANPIEADLGELAPGQSRDITSTFTITTPGPQCNNVEVTGQGGLRASGRACVTAVPSAGGVAPPVATPSVPAQPSTGAKPTLVAKKTGPTSAAVGDTATFEIEITNNSSVPATGVKVADNYDLTLDPTSATDGHAFVGDDLVWQVDGLPPGKTMRFQVVCRCVARTNNACNRVTVTCQEGARADAQSCLAIQGSNTPLQLSVSDLNDPVAVGNDVTYQVRVTNPSAAPDTQVQVNVTLGTQTSPLATGITGPASYTIDGNTVRFAPVASIAAGATLTYLVPARAVQAGTTRMRAEVTSANAPNAAAAEETTTIFAQCAPGSHHPW